MAYFREESNIDVRNHYAGQRVQPDTQKDVIMRSHALNNDRLLPNKRFVTTGEGIVDVPCNGPKQTAATRVGNLYQSVTCNLEDKYDQTVVDVPIYDAPIPILTTTNDATMNCFESDMYPYASFQRVPPPPAYTVEDESASRTTVLPPVYESVRCAAERE